jgi:Na+-transporting NADH:ubiquinone oxidoreductase subunit F
MELNPLQIVLIASGIACVLSGVLATLLVLAERFLVNYGPCTIDVNRGAKRFEVTGGEMLLTSLRNEGIFLPSACGGRGTCAYCKCQIDEGGGPVAPTEEPLLTDQEVGSSVRISCLVKVRNDLSIVVPEQLLFVRQFRGVVERIRDLTYDMKELRIKLIQPDTIDFIAGQYVQLDTPPYASVRESVFRAYSMSSPPSEKNAIELIIRLVPGGICTTWVFTLLKEGDEVTFTGPFGDFRLSDTDREMLWVAGGSGMAPFWSIIRDMREKNVQRRCTYFFGAVGKRDLFLIDELRELEQELPWFTFIPALSEPNDGDHWDGETGLITEVVDRHVKDSADEQEAYLCGSGGMIDAAINVLKGKNIPDERIFYDKFT